ncbi:hypothetical protein DL765_011755 [Monosporascus sp. GIB2]|nr:hypothetical protein DL765_011755 [Monosporascus sp. GIB2]
MGWLRVTVDFVLRVTQLGGFSPSIGHGDAQQPLQHHSIVDSVPPLARRGNYGESQGRPYTPIVCSYPELEAKGWEFCNTEDSRDCWIRDPNENQPSSTQWDVRTNYEQDTPPGITREYWLEVTDNPDVSPDDFPKILGKYFNGAYPGPTIQACWGDQLVIHVTNTRSDNGTTVHWHGIRQLDSNEMDGANGVTQCPISTNDTFTQLGPVMISDWVHETAFKVFMVEMRGDIPAMDSIVVNGHGHFNGSGSYFETCLTSKKRHILRLINSSAATSFVFSIDDHDLTVITNDLVAIEPFTVQSLFIGIGQRYTVIVEAKDQAEGDYWIRTVPAAECGRFSLPPDNRTGIIRYDCGSGGEVLPLPPDREPQPQNNTCDDVHTEWLNPIVPWRVDRHPQNNMTEDTFGARLQDAPDTSLGPPGFPYRHWFLAEQPMWLDFSRPTILHIDEAMQNPNYTIIEEDYNDGFVYLIVHSGNIPAGHPMHLHGSDFVILAQSREPWNETTSPRLFRYDNPPRRDTAMLPAGGFLAMAFKPENPGSWLLHCHIVWHASSGLALQILVRPYDMPDFLGDLTETKRICDNWAETPLALAMPTTQDDSGI